MYLERGFIYKTGPFNFVLLLKRFGTRNGWDSQSEPSSVDVLRSNLLSFRQGAETGKRATVLNFNTNEI